MIQWTLLTLYFSVMGELWQFDNLWSWCVFGRRHRHILARTSDPRTHSNVYSICHSWPLLCFICLHRLFIFYVLQMMSNTCIEITDSVQWRCVRCPATSQLESFPDEAAGVALSFCFPPTRPLWGPHCDHRYKIPLSSGSLWSTRKNVTVSQLCSFWSSLKYCESSCFWWHVGLPVRQTV